MRQSRLPGPCTRPTWHAVGCRRAAVQADVDYRKNSGRQIADTVRRNRMARVAERAQVRHQMTGMDQILMPVQMSKLVLRLMQVLMLMSLSLSMSMLKQASLGCRGQRA